MLNTMTYEQYRTQRQKEFNSLPLFFAYSDDQFREGMEKRGLTENDTDKIYRLGGLNCFYLKTDKSIIDEFFNRPDKLPEMMQDYDFCKGAVLYEMNNHEYCINWQGDFDVMSCFGNVHYVDALDELDQYFDQFDWSETQRKAYRAARREHMTRMEEMGYI